MLDLELLRESMRRQDTRELAQLTFGLQEMSITDTTLLAKPVSIITKSSQTPELQLDQDFQPTQKWSQRNLSTIWKLKLLEFNKNVTPKLKLISIKKQMRKTRKLTQRQRKRKPKKRLPPNLN